MSAKVKAKAKEKATAAPVVLLSGKELATEIKQIATTAKELSRKLQLIAISCCVEAVKTGNITHMIHFDKAVEHVGRRAIRRWLVKHGPVKWDLTAKTFVTDTEKKAKAKADVEAYTAKLLTAKTYVEESTETDTDPFLTFDVMAMLKAIERRHEKVKDSTDARHNFVGYDKVIKLIKELEPTYVKPARAAPVKTGSNKPATEAATPTLQ